MLIPAALATADVASGVLAIAGVAKLHDPSAFAGFLSTLGWRPRRRRAEQLARVVGAGELTIALAALIIGGTVWFAVLGLTYLALAAAAARALVQRAPSCGCFGAASAPTTPSHVVLDVLFAIGGLGAAAADGAPLVDRLHGADGVAYLLLVGLATALAVITMTTAAELTAARRS